MRTIGIAALAAAALLTYGCDSPRGSATGPPTGDTALPDSGAEAPDAAVSDTRGSEDGGDAPSTGDVPAPDAATDAPDATADAGPDAPPEDVPAGPVGLPVLGGEGHDLEAVEWGIVGDASDGLAQPTDLAFDPEDPAHVWIVNKDTDSVTVLFDVATDDQQSLTFGSPGSTHFNARPSSIAFGASGTMATIHETDEKTQGPNGTPEDFMGPTLFATDLAFFDAGHGAHLDMLHNTPNGMGITWEQGNAYWVFDGYHQALTRYDFAGDHGPGGADHSDGEILRYAEGLVKRVADVPSHMEVDLDAGLLYVADTGHARIATLDIHSGTQAGAIFPNYDGTSQHHVEGAELRTLVDGTEVGLEQPSGLALAGDVLYVTDHATSRVWAFDRDGDVLDWLDTGMPAGSLMGIAVASDGRLFLADAANDRVFWIGPKSQP